MGVDMDLGCQGDSNTSLSLYEFQWSSDHRVLGSGGLTEVDTTFSVGKEEVVPETRGPGFLVHRTSSSLRIYPAVFVVGGPERPINT